jgi:hypothetical protein
LYWNVLAGREGAKIEEANPGKCQHDKKREGELSGGCCVNVSFYFPVSFACLHTFDSKRKGREEGRRRWSKNEKDEWEGR